MSETPAKYEVATRADAMPVQGNAVSAIMDAMRDPTVDPKKLHELLAVRREWEQDEARKAFAIAMAGFSSECPIIEPIDQGDRNKYAKIDRIHRHIRPLKAKYGLFVAWTEETITDDGKQVSLRGILGHRDGFSMPIAFDMPFADRIVSREGKDVINVTQRAGSTISYARRYGECAILNVVTGKDTDGAWKPEDRLDDGAAAELAGALRGLPEERRTAFWAWISRTAQREISAERDIPRALYAQAMRAIEKAKGGAK